MLDERGGRSLKREIRIQEGNSGVAHPAEGSIVNNSKAPKDLYGGEDMGAYASAGRCPQWLEDGTACPGIPPGLPHFHCTDQGPEDCTGNSLFHINPAVFGAGGDPFRQMDKVLSAKMFLEVFSVDEFLVLDPKHFSSPRMVIGSTVRDSYPFDPQFVLVVHPIIRGGYMARVHVEAGVAGSEHGDQIAPVSDAFDSQNTCCNKRFWCIRDVCGIICVLMTWGLLLYAGFVVVVVILPWKGSGFPPLYNFINLVVFNCLAFLAAASHARAMLTDPGAVPKGSATREMMQKMGFEEGDVVFKCPKCCSIKPEQAHHCSSYVRDALKRWIIIARG
ncbi:unnamed protein product [Notodromas monacha]|uniref:Uncharacterized protein n=1 Tax=Notodromas monacha TaxID=399045 RepID=A0A7R9GH54_9CRUS|nr:unnamed protein product [Notodromas monacha]CAG0921120.1 unnamed protein product [Notodromas monacha]